MGLFRRRKPAAPPPNEMRVNVAFVLLSRPQLPEVEAIVKAFASIAPNRPAPRRTENDDASSGEIMLLDAGDDSGVMVMLLPVPVPEREADEAVRFSISAFNTGWTLSPHQAHLVVTLQTPSSALDSLLFFTPILAAIAEASAAVGIYWGNAGATHDPKSFIELAREDSVESQILLWNGVSVASERDGRLSLLSLGMKQLDLPDLWLIAPNQGAPLEWFFDLLSYVAREGKSIPDGDTIGRTAEEKIPVRYVPSPIDDSTQVCRIEIP
jgi:hypothetical protein